MNIQSLPWFKFAHDAYLVSEFKAKANAFAKAAYLDLLCYAMKQTPALSLPNDDNVLAGWASLALEAWLQIKELVLSQFSFNQNDNRYYSPMLIELYSDTEQPQANEQQAPRKRSSSAERVARHRANKKAIAEANKAVTHDVTLPCNAPVTPETVTSNANVTPVTVTMGGKGGDLECRLDNLDKNIVVTDIVTNQSVTPCNAVTPQQTTRFKMPFDFNVSIEELQPFMAKLEVPITKHNHHHLNHFVAHYLATDFKNTHEQWVFQYAKWLERQKLSPINTDNLASTPNSRSTVSIKLADERPQWQIFAERAAAKKTKQGQGFSLAS
ncbi:DUF1376 domain-containing protein [Agitococcus lubricus]|uniref:Uncharacterized protein DUF1376 n=1 Tax=Agitococcus lubricus TaxID=1077255 RepID=A0A2T5J1D7_9GAMM|nr:DUF1376 domain-containing protein [Agitococcus lubricus]PTQ90256.1 uncharacterized protein DUF1376 [Agitococcus lubricus]